MSRLAPAIGPNTLTPGSMRGGGYKSEFKTTYDRNPDKNSGHFGSVSELGINPDGTMGMASKLESLKPYFGHAQRQSKEDPYSWWDTENHTLPDGLRGKCQYLLNIIITAILTSEMWPVTEALPYKKADSLTVEWDEWRFNDHMLDRVPEEAVARMVTNSKNSFAVHIIRHGKAFMLEHGFWLTPMGQKNWAMNIIQIVNATTETACFGAVVAYLTALPYVDNNNQFGSKRQNNNRDIDSMMVEETDGFARVQKEENGYNIMVAKMQQIFRDRNGHDANYLIIPSGCNQAIRARPEENYAIYNGVGVTNRDVNREGGGMTVRTSRGFRVGEKQANLDPHFAFVCIGGFFVMTDAASNLVPIELYRTQHRDVEIFSMSKDDYVRIEYTNMFDYLGLYKDWTESDSPPISWIGHQFLAKYRSWGKLLDAANAKQSVVDKIERLDKDEYEEFHSRFVSKSNEQLLEFGDDERAVSFDILDMNQPTIRENFEVDDAELDSAVRVDRRAPFVWPSKIRDVMDAVVAASAKTRLADATDEFHLSFTNDKIVSCNDSSSDFVSIPALYLYQCASHNFVLFNFECKPNRNLPTLTPNGDLAQEKREIKQYCARVQLSIAVSILVGLLRWFNNDKVAADPESTHLGLLATKMKTWLQSTRDYSGLLSEFDESTLEELYSSAQSQAAIDYKKLTQIKGQLVIPFPLLIECIFLIAGDADTDIIINLLKVASNNLLYVYDPNSVGVSEQHIKKTSYSDAADAFREAANYNKATSSPIGAHLVVNKGKVKDGITRKVGEFGVHIKVATENALITLAGGGRKSAADQALLLDGFRSRFFALAPVIGQIWLVDVLAGNGKNLFMKDDWFVSVLIVMAKLPNRTIAVRFLDDILRIVASNSVPNVTASDESLLSTLKFIAPATDGLINLTNFTDADKKNVLTNQIAAYLNKIESDEKERDPNYEYVEFDQVIVAATIEATNDLADYQRRTADVNDDDVNSIRDVTDAENDVAVDLKQISDKKTTEKDYARDNAGYEKAAVAILLLSNQDDNKINNRDVAVCLDIIHAFNPTDYVDRLFKLLLCNAPNRALVGGSINRYCVRFNEVAIERLSVLSEMCKIVFTSDITRPVVKQMNTAFDYWFDPAPSTSSRPSLARQQTSKAGVTVASSSSSSSSSSHQRAVVSPAPLYTSSSSSSKPTSSRARQSKATTPKTAQRLHGVKLKSFLDTVPLTNGYWAKYSMRKNLPMPIGSIGFRLHKQYEMGTAVMMDKGGAAGYTYFGYADMQLGDDIGKKVHVAHFTLYLKSVVMFNRLIVYSRYVISRHYGGGEGTEPWHPLDDGDRDDFRQGRMLKDIIFAPVLSNFRAQHIVMDATGRFPPSMTPDQVADDSVHYESAELIRTIWGMQHNKTTTIQVSTLAPLFQTIALQEHTQTWNMNKHGYTDITIDHTHWGPRVYPKCGKVRRGQSSYLERCSWEQTKTLTIGV